MFIRRGRRQSSIRLLRCGLSSSCMNNWLENVWMALDTLRQHKLRSFLTVLGVIIGTGTIIGVGSIIAGLDGAITLMEEIERHLLLLESSAPSIFFTLLIFRTGTTSSRTI